MTPEEHYAEAERSLAVAETTYWEGPEARIEFAQTALMAAQVHATLAIAPPAVPADGAGEMRGGR